jgi:transposase InsO family protein
MIASRVAYSQVLPDEQGDCASMFLRAAVVYYAGLGVVIREILTDNRSCYRSLALRATAQALGLKHRFALPYTPRSNGKADRFIRSALREWAYARAYRRSDQRPMSWRTGCTATTGIARMPAWQASYPSPESVSTGTTC